MAHNYPKWPKNDARIYAFFPQFFLTEKVVPQTFSLLESYGLVIPDLTNHITKILPVGTTIDMLIC